MTLMRKLHFVINYSVVSSLKTSLFHFFLAGHSQFLSLYTIKLKNNILIWHLKVIWP